MRDRAFDVVDRVDNEARNVARSVPYDQRNETAVWARSPNVLVAVAGDVWRPVELEAIPPQMLKGDPMRISSQSRNSTLGIALVG